MQRIERFIQKEEQQQPLPLTELPALLKDNPNLADLTDPQIDLLDRELPNQKKSQIISHFIDTNNIVEITRSQKIFIKLFLETTNDHYKQQIELLLLRKINELHFSEILKNKQFCTLLINVHNLNLRNQKKSKEESPILIWFKNNVLNKKILHTWTMIISMISY